VGIGNSQADAVYRCGSSYSRSAQCAQEAATEVNAHTEPRHHASTPKAAVANEQREADALEKKRLQAERLAAQNQPVHVVVPWMGIRSGGKEPMALAFPGPVSM
jgi:hypothetical protein